MEFDPDVSKLERVVDKLLDKYELLKKDFEQLTLDLADSHAQLDELKGEKIILLNEKDTIHSKVTSILGKLSEWEDGLEGESDSDRVDVSQEPGGQLFTMGSSS